MSKTLKYIFILLLLCWIATDSFANDLDLNKPIYEWNAEDLEQLRKLYPRTEIVDSTDWNVFADPDGRLNLKPEKKEVEKVYSKAEKQQINAHLQNVMESVKDPELILRYFEKATDDAVSKFIVPAAKRLFFILLTLSLFIALVKILLDASGTITHVFILLGRQIFFGGFMLWLFEGATRSWGNYPLTGAGGAGGAADIFFNIPKLLIHSFAVLGNRIATIEVSPKALCVAGIKCFSDIWASAQGMLETLGTLVIGLVILYCFCQIAASLIQLVVEIYLAVAAGIMLLAFSPLEQTKDLYVNYLRYGLTAGMKYFSLCLIGGLSIRFSSVASSVIHLIGISKNNFLVTLGSLLSAVMILAYTAKNTPAIVGAMVGQASAGASMGGGMAGLAGGAIGAYAGTKMALHTAASPLRAAHKAANTAANLANAGAAGAMAELGKSGGGQGGKPQQGGTNGAPPSPPSGNVLSADPLPVPQGNTSSASGATSGPASGPSGGVQDIPGGSGPSSDSGPSASAAAPSASSDYGQQMSQLKTQRRAQQRAAAVGTVKGVLGHMAKTALFGAQHGANHSNKAAASAFRQFKSETKQDYRNRMQSLKQQQRLASDVKKKENPESPPPQPPRQQE